MNKISNNLGLSQPKVPSDPAADRCQPFLTSHFLLSFKEQRNAGRSSDTARRRGLRRLPLIRIAAG
jgi:hypothetical protein